MKRAAVAAVLGLSRAALLVHGLGLRGIGNSSSDLSANITAGHAVVRGDGPPCQCTVDSQQWKRPGNRRPACLFFDLGANDGEVYKVFVHQSAKWKFNFDTGSFAHEQCYAYLIEANPAFTAALEKYRTNRVYPLQSSAVYMCDKDHVNFYVDSWSPSAWGSSLDSDHPSVKAKKKTVHVKMLNLMRLLIENAVPEDNVVVKMDIEGAEWDILPCLARSPAAKLIDTLYLENHCKDDDWCPTTGQAGTTRKQWNEAITTLKAKGVHIPDKYWSPM